MSALISNKKQCSFCNKKFQPKFCKICVYRDYGLCERCHKKTEHHKVEVKRNVR